MRAAVHPQQTERLRQLRQYEILDTEHEADFDEIVELASTICSTPISAINFIDAERQWFKAEVGLGARETPLESSICSHVILQPDFVEISDTLTDPRMRDNPLCRGNPGLRFYAGALLKTKNGLPLGTLCVLDHEPRTLVPLQRAAIRILANQVMKQLDLRLAVKSQHILRQEIDHRVKNSLQAVSSMIRLQRNRATSANEREALEVVERRVSTIAALHEELYRTETGARIDLKLFMANIERLLSGSCPEHVQIEMSFDSVHLNSRQASSVAMIVCEFVTNSIKHAFPHGRQGIIRVEGRGVEPTRVELRCEDNGVGFKEGLASRENGGLGLKIMDVSAVQLGGTSEHWSTDEGSTLTVTFQPAL